MLAIVVTLIIKDKPDGGFTHKCTIECKQMVDSETKKDEPSTESENTKLKEISMDILELVERNVGTSTHMFEHQYEPQGGRIMDEERLRSVSANPNRSIKTFIHFPEQKKCPVCGTSEDKECVLVTIDGTAEGNIAQAEVVHLECAVATNIVTGLGEGRAIMYRLIKPYGSLGD